MEDRRNFLKIFGLGTAVVASAKSIEKVEQSPEEVEPLITAGAKFNRALTQKAPFAWPNSRSHDVVSETLYSKLTIPKNTMESRYTLYDYAVGIPHTDGVHDLSDTNSYMPRRLCAPEYFCVKQLGIVFSSTTKRMLQYVFAERFSFSLWLHQKRYFQSPIAFAALRGDKFAPSAMFDISDLPLIIPYDYQFHVELTTSRPIMPHGKIVLWSVLGGLMARGIQ